VLNPGVGFKNVYVLNASLGCKYEAVRDTRDCWYFRREVVVHLYVAVNIAIGHRSMAVREAISGKSTDCVERPEDSVGILEVVVHNIHKEIVVHNVVN
jgi:hypothetical protein